MHDQRQPVDVRVVGESDWIAATDACRLCVIEMTAVMELVDLGLVASRGSASSEWQLRVAELPRLRIAARLMRDLGVNGTGAVLAVELLEARRDLERQIRRLERLLHE